MQEGFAGINGRKMYYKLLQPDLLQPDLPVLVFLHEGLGCVEQWKDFPQKLAERLGLPALLYDRLRYGRSDAWDQPFASDYLHREAFEVLPALLHCLGITQKLILVGHSDGGTIALLFAAKFPQRVLAVVSEADHVVNEPITREGIQNTVKAYQEGMLKKQLVRYHGAKTDDLFYGWSGFLLSPQGEQWNILTELSQIRCPVLAIQGKKDVYGSIHQLGLKMQHIAADVNVLLLEDCGHIPHREKQATVIQSIACFGEILQCH
ncbi:MAG: alpha/beta fold hydrolase [Bacteroidales bacterium]